MKVLVVDDEPRHTRILAQIIKDFRHDYEVVEATSGAEVLKRNDLKEFDLVISDIRMPGIDGLSMLEQLTKCNPRVKIVIISGYGEFEYARKALSLNACQYILKPINPQTIREVVDQVESSVISQRNAQRYRRKLSSHYRNHLISGWLSGKCSDDEYAEIKKIIPSCRYNLVIKITPRNGIHISKDEELSNLRKFLNAFRQKGLFILARAPDHGSGCTCIIGGDELSLVRTILAEAIEDLPGYNFAVSCPEADILGNCKQCYDQACIASACFFYMPGSRTIRYEEIAAKFRKDICITPKAEDECLKAVIGETDLASWTEGWIYSIIGDTYPDPLILTDEIKRVLVRVLNRLGSALTESDIVSLEKSIGESIQEKCPSIEALKDCIRYCMAMIRHYVQRYRNDRAGHIIERCIEELRENYHMDYSLAEMAEKYYFNPSYFSTLFKKYTGVHFTDYLINLRVERAKQLLLETNDKIYQIAKKVGYQDVKYFTRVFKKKYGCTPEEFRIYGAKF